MSNTLSDSFLQLVAIMDDLRERCPWDRKQTIDTLRPLTIEETYELTGAISKGDWQGIKEELGDLLLHILFYAKIGTEQKQFTMQEVIDTISKKLVYRHPHIYGDIKVDNEEDVKRNWEKLKLIEGNKTLLSGVPDALPALVKATRIQEKVRQVGFDWPNKEMVWDKVEEEIAELKEAIEKKEPEAVEEEFGDLLFSLINFARFLQVDTEGALEKSNRKFIKRFNMLESKANASGKQLTEMNLDEMDKIWNEIKHLNNSI